jgi:hypothetical protein
MSLIELNPAEVPTWTPAGEITITSDAQFVEVAERRKAIRQFVARVESFFAPLKSKAQAAHKALCDSERQHIAPAQADMAHCDRALRVWEAAQEQARREEQRRLEAQARHEAETRALAEAAQLEREAAATGDVALLAEAEALISEPVDAPVIILPKATPSVAGLSYREVWQYEVTDDAAIPREYLVRDDKKLGAVVRAMKGAAKIPGVRVFCTKTVVTR